MVIAQQPAQAFTALNFTLGIVDVWACHRDGVPQALMISFAMKVEQKFTNCDSQRVFVEENHLFEAFFLNRAMEALNPSIQVRASRRQADRFDACGGEQRAKGGTESSVPVHQQVAL